MGSKFLPLHVFLVFIFFSYLPRFFLFWLRWLLSSRVLLMTRPFYSPLLAEVVAATDDLPFFFLSSIPNSALRSGYFLQT